MTDYWWEVVPVGSMLISYAPIQAEVVFRDGEGYDYVVDLFDDKVVAIRAASDGVSEKDDVE